MSEQKKETTAAPKEGANLPTGALPVGAGSNQPKAQPTEAEEAVDVNAAQALAASGIPERFHLPMMKTFGELMKKALENMPGIQALNQRQKKALERVKKGTIVKKEMEEYLALHARDRMVSVELTGKGDLGDSYNCRLVSMLGVGVHTGIPESLANRLVRDFPRDFKLVN